MATVASRSTSSRNRRGKTKNQIGCPRRRDRSSWLCVSTGQNPKHWMAGGSPRHSRKRAESDVKVIHLCEWEGLMIDQAVMTRRDTLFGATILAPASALVKLIVVVACLLIGSAFAQEPGKLAPLPNKLPPSVEQRVGTVD